MAEDISLYNGEVVLRMAKNHVYTVTDGGQKFKVPSVTTILKIINKGEAMVQWAANCASEYMRAALQPGQVYTAEELREVCNRARFNFRKVSEKAMDIGNITHHWVEEYLLKGEEALFNLPANPEAAKSSVAASTWLRQQSFRPTKIEMKLYSRKHRFAGTMDAGGSGVVWVNNRKAIVDWKTSKAIYDEHRLQLAAYNVAYEEMTGEEIDERWLVRLGKDDGEFEAECYPRETLARDFNAFLLAKQLFEHMKWYEEQKRAAA